MLRHQNGLGMEMDLKQLMDLGLSVYYENLESLSREEQTDLLNQIFSINVSNEPVLALVNDFALKHKLFTDILDDNDNLFKVQSFCGNHIVSLNKPYKKAEYNYRRDRYYNDNDLMETLNYFDLDKDQFWYLTLFCWYYVNSLTTKLCYTSPTIEKELNLIVDGIKSMEFNQSDWREAYPKYPGQITLNIEGQQKPYKVCNPQTLNVLSVLIKQFLAQKHDEYTDFALTCGGYTDKEGIRIKYLEGLESKSAEEEKDYRKKSLEYYMADAYDFDDSETRRLALFHYYMKTSIETPTEEKEDTNNQSLFKITHSKTFLISKMIYILNILPTNGNNESEKQTEAEKKLLPYYNDRRYFVDKIKNCFKSCNCGVKQLDTQEDVDKYLKWLSEQKQKMQ